MHNSTIKYQDLFIIKCVTNGSFIVTFKSGLKMLHVSPHRHKQKCLPHVSLTTPPQPLKSGNYDSGEYVPMAVHALY